METRKIAHGVFVDDLDQSFDVGVVLDSEFTLAFEARKLIVPVTPKSAYRPSERKGREGVDLRGPRNIQVAHVEITPKATGGTRLKD